MRIMHTSDWHLGRALQGESLLEDQAHALQQLVDLLREDAGNPNTRTDLLILAGDVYDRAVPPRDAVSLLDATLSEIVGGLRIPTLVIAGNHDSPERVGFGAELLKGAGLLVAGPLQAEPASLVFQDAAGPIRVFALPYAGPGEARRVLDEGIRSHEGVLAAQVAACRSRLGSGERSVVVGHAFVTGAETSDSEEELAVGGSSGVNAAVFQGLDYVALGHLHRPQSLAGGRIRYSGSLLKYSFSEAAHSKGILRLELDRDGLRCETLALTPRRDLRILEGDFHALLEGETQGPADDLLLIRLLDTLPQLDAIHRLRKRYPNVLQLEWPNQQHGGTAAALAGDHRQFGHEELFSRFYQDLKGAPLEPAQLEAYRDLVDALADSRRAL